MNGRYLFLLYIIILSGCSVIRSSKVRVKKTPSSNAYTVFDDIPMRDGSPVNKSWWVVYSDREGNETYVSPDGELTQTQVNYLQPMYVIGEQNDMLNVIMYDPALNAALKNGMLDRKSVKWLGWIEKSKTLTWNAALKNSNNGFNIKTAVTIKNSAAIEKADKYISDDSLQLFTSPLLDKNNGKKLSAGCIVYMYKISADKQAVLIGKGEQLSADNIKEEILGWISVDATALWGTRAAFIASKEMFAIDSVNFREGFYTSKDLALFKNVFSPVISPYSFAWEKGLKRILPINEYIPAKGKTNDITKTAIWTDVLDYSKNTVLNVLGKEINDAQFRKIITSGAALNVAFVLDGSDENRLYYPSILSVIQQLQSITTANTEFVKIKAGVVIYNGASCTNERMSEMLPLTENINDVISFFQKKPAVENTCGGADRTPLYNGLVAACQLFERSKEATNLIIVVGAKGNTENTYSINDVITGISRIQARMLFFQTLSKPNDAYNNYVLQAQQVVSGSAANISELKKMKIVDVNEVLPDVQYKAGVKEGMYMLDYPDKSMTQGMVLFPQKGEVLQATTLKAGVDTLLWQMNNDYKKTNQSLINYFKSLGIRRSFIEEKYKTLFAETLSDSLPQAFLKNYHGYQQSFFIPVYKAGKVDNKDSLWQNGVLLSTREIDRLIDVYNGFYKAAIVDGYFDRRKAVSRYTTFIKKYRNDNQLSGEKKEKNISVAESVEIVTGLRPVDSLSVKATLGMLKKSNKVNDKQILQLWKQFRLFATALQKQKTTAQAIVETGCNKFYWVPSTLFYPNK